MKKKLIGTLVMVMMTAQMQLVLRQMRGDLEDAEASPSQVHASASRSFQEARELLTRVKSARGYFPVVGIGAFDGLAQPSTDPEPAKSRGKGKHGKRRGKSSYQKDGKSPLFGTPGILSEPQTPRSESRPPMSKKLPTETAVSRGGALYTPRLRPDQCMLCRQVGHRASVCLDNGTATTLFSRKTCAWYLCSGLCSVRFSVLRDSI